jgi:endonuclease/exonuclease/phosphatase family metal-dependent hydrolase
MTTRRAFFAVYLIVLAGFLFFAGPASAIAANAGNISVRVMTRNMDAGTDLNYFLNPEIELPTALQLTLEEVVASDIPGRAARLATEIGIEKPDIVALQEVSIWRIYTSETNFVELDQLNLLLAALDEAGLHYAPAAVNPLTDILIPGVAEFVDRDAILIRSDIKQLSVVGTEFHHYPDETLLEFPILGGIKVLRGWAAIDVNFRGTRFKFVTTHLESGLPVAVIPDHDPNHQPQVAQAAQLIYDLSTVTVPIILAGDFNSNAELTNGYPPDSTPSYSLIALSGYVDAWEYRHGKDPGYTWPLFGEDGLTWPGPLERIDLIFSKGSVMPSVVRMFGERTIGGFYASDHIGLVADFIMPK